MALSRIKTTTRILGVASFVIAWGIPAASFADDTVRFDIEAQPLSEALTRFSEQADLTVVAASELTEGKTAPRVVGEFAEDTALETLLRDSGLDARREGNLILIAAVDTQAAAASQQSVTQSTARTAPPAQRDMGADIEEVVVTGSRITRDSFTSVSPLQVVDAATIEQSGFTNIDDVLLRQPAIGIGLGSSLPFRNPDAGAAFVSLRGLGTNRSLTLINGRRRVSGSSRSSAVDLNTIPSGVIERIEIITGGVSAVYGADAVSGAINIITKKDFEGLEFAARGGISGQGDADNYAFDLLGGTQFNDGKGYMSFTATYSRQAELMANERDYGVQWLASRPNADNTGPNDGIPDRITVLWRFPYITQDVNFFFDGDYFTYGDNGLTQLTIGPELRPGPTGFNIGGDGDTLVQHTQFRIPVDVFAFRNEFKYELTDKVSFFAEADFTNTETAHNLEFRRFDARPIFFNGRGGPIVRTDNPYMPQEVRDLLAANGVTEAPARKQSIVELGFRRNQHNRNTFTGVGGFEGEFGNNWQWSAFYQYGRYTDDIQTPNLLHGSNYLNAVDVIADPDTGEPVCRDEAARAAGCVPYNIFVSAPYSSAQREYFVYERLQDVENTQSIAGATLTGDAFELPAGPVQFAIGAEYREETLSTRDDSLVLDGEHSMFDITPRPPLDEEFDVSEAFVEVVVPVVRDVPLINQLDLEAAVRFSDYSMIGQTDAWRIGANWQLDDSLRLRFTAATSVRAPNLNELFAPTEESIFNYEDACDASRINVNPNREANCRALGIPEGFVEDRGTDTVLIGGNPELTEEESDSFTAGVVFTPTFVEGLSLAVDYFDIEIDGAVSAFTAIETGDRCVDSSTIDNPFCERITFAPDGNISEIDIRSINLGRLSTSGIDFTADYQFDLARLGQVGLRLDGSYLIEKEELVVPDDSSTLIIRDGEFTDPTLRFNLTLSLQRNRWYLAVVNRYIDESDIDRQAGPEDYDIPTIDAEIYSDLRFQFAFGDRSSFNLGVNNVFDVEPQQTAQTQFGGATIGRGTLGAAYYDNIGRFFTAGVRTRF